MLSTRDYSLPQGLSLAQIQKDLSQFYTFAQDGKNSSKTTYFDTFDWRLYRQGTVLARSVADLAILSLETGEALVSAPFRGEAVPLFWWQLAESEVRRFLKKNIDVRALIAVVTTEIEHQALRILNQDEKSVLGLRLGQVTSNAGLPSQNLLRFLRVSVYRGYTAHLPKFDAFMTRAGAEKLPCSLHHLVLQHSTRKPGLYSAKFKLELTHQMSALEAGLAILRHLFNIMRENEAGIRQDIDTEFLHDYRVAIRRARTALGQIKGVLPPEMVERLKREFRHLSRQTNRLRDLDVYLLHREEYRRLLPESMRNGLKSLFDRLRRQRRTEQRKLAAALEADAYQRISGFFQDCLGQENARADLPHDAQRPAKEAAKLFIFKRYKKVVALGKKITRLTPDSTLHELRIECKKLRYLLEFFASLFSGQQIETLIVHLKKLQDNLGEFNDLSVQQKFLKEHLCRLQGRSSMQDEEIVALGALIGILYHKQIGIRKNFAATFRRFDAPENQKLFREHFK